MLGRVHSTQYCEKLNPFSVLEIHQQKPTARSLCNKQRQTTALSSTAKRTKGIATVNIILLKSTINKDA